MNEFVKYLVKKSDLSKNEFYNYNTKKSEISKEEIKKELQYKKISEPVFVDYVVFDFETTGLSPVKNKILEIGAVKIRKGKLVDSFSELINPKIKIPKYISEKIGIYDDMVKDSRTTEEVLLDFLEFIGKDVLVAHNAKFDMGFLINNANVIGREINNEVIDTLELGRKYLKETKRHNLNTLCEYFGVENKNAHRAYSDALATNEIYKIIQKKYI